MNTQDTAGRAAAAGLDLTPAQHIELARATALVERLACALPHDLALADEPALVFRLHRRGRA